MSLNSVFSIAKSSLFAHQQALAVTSSNLANVNNPAYSRQVALFGTLAPDHRGTFRFGTGVAVASSKATGCALATETSSPDRLVRINCTCSDSSGRSGDGGSEDTLVGNAPPRGCPRGRTPRPRRIRGGGARSPRGPIAATGIAPSAPRSGSSRRSCSRRDSPARP